MVAAKLLEIVCAEQVWKWKREYVGLREPRAVGQDLATSDEPNIYTVSLTTVKLK